MQLHEIPFIFIRNEWLLFCHLSEIVKSKDIVSCVLQAAVEERPAIVILLRGKMGKNDYRFALKEGPEIYRDQNNIDALLT